jgi:hypothetical protein
MRLVRQLPDRHLLSANGRGFHRSLGQSPQGLCWQRGYGAFSVSPSQLDALLGYVETQEERHRSRTFQEEYASSCANTASSMTNVMCGIEATPPVSRAFSARSEAVNIPGRLPQAG